MFGKYSPDEGFALAVAALIGIVAWAHWYYVLAAVACRVRKCGQRWPLQLVPVVSALLLYVVLSKWSAEDVRTDPAYMLFYMIVGMAWVSCFRWQLPRFGLSARDDVVERGNDAAGWAVAGALVGGTCCFAGANVGNGPGWWVVLFSGFLSTASLLFLWWIVHLGCGLAEKVTVERDLAAGLRAAGWFVATGLILGRAVAGDWVSAGATVMDFVRMGWPSVVLTGGAIALERFLPVTTTPTLGRFLAGWLPAVSYVGLAVGVLFVLQS